MQFPAARCSHTQSSLATLAFWWFSSQNKLVQGPSTRTGDAHWSTGPRSRLAVAASTSFPPRARSGDRLAALGVGGVRRLEWASRSGPAVGGGRCHDGMACGELIVDMLTKGKPLPR